MNRRDFTKLALGAGTALAAPAVAHAQAVRLNFPCWQFEEPGFGEWWTKVITAYEATNPAVKVEPQQIAFRDYINQLTIRFASNRPPDILVLPASSFGGFASQGWLDSVEARMAADGMAGSWSTLQSELVWDGHHLGVLLMGYGFMLFYNEQRLTEAGTARPTNFTEFAAAVQKVTARDRGIFGLAAVTTEHPTVVQDLIRFILWQGQELVVARRYNLTNPDVARAIDVYRQVVGGNSPLGTNSTVARQLYVDGKTGFLIDGPWMWARIEQAAPAMRPHLKMMAAPFSPVLGGAANSIHIPAALDPSRKDQVWSFIRFVARPEWQREYMLLTASPPGRTNVLTDTDKAAAPHLGAIADAARGALGLVPTIRSILANVNEFSDIIQRAALRVLSTRDPVARILRETQAELERAVPIGGPG